MRKFFTSVFLAVISAVTIAWLGSSPASAATFTVTNGGDFTGSANLVFTDGSTQITCTGTASGTAFNGTGSGAGIADIHVMLRCTGPFGVTGTVTGSLGSFNAVSISGGVVQGTLTGVSLAAVLSDILGTCNMSMTGTLGNVSYNNSGTFTITRDAGLTIPSASGSGCAGLVRAGDRVPVQGTITISPAFHVTSP